ncbi:MAG: DNA repair protein RecO [Anaerolineales bacterium]|nr:DNA repair protein RecO [Anaerolineales bacterium]
MDQRRQRLYRTPALILKRQDLGEADRILTLFTPAMGKVRAVAKGVRKITSRKSGHVELFTYSNLLIAKGRNLDIVTQAETIKPFRVLREDLARITYAYYIAEVVDHFTEERDENRPLFDLMLATLDAFEQTADIRRTTRYFELRLLDAVGYRPQLFRCVQCNQEIEPVENYFGLAAGGVVCPDCVVNTAEGTIIRETYAETYAGHGARPAAVRPITVNALKVLRFMQREPYATVDHLNIRRETHSEMERLLHHYLTYLLERDLKSIEFLETLSAVRRARVKHARREPYV